MSPPLAVVGGTVIDGTGADPKRGATVSIRDGRIETVSAEGPPRDAEVIDATDRFVVPGLMDLHIHISLPMSADDPGANETPISEYTTGLSVAYGLNNARNLVLKGVTTIRDVGSHGHGILALQHLRVGPGSGPADDRLWSSDRDDRWPRRTDRRGSGQPDEVRRLARYELKAGARALKLVASGGGIDARENPRHVELTAEELRAAVEVAHARGVTTATHAHNPEAAENGSARQAPIQSSMASCWTRNR